MPRTSATTAFFATVRLTDLVVEDKITEPIRTTIQERWPDSKASYLVTCKKCVSVWAALAVASGKIPRPVVWALALSGATILFDRQDDRVGEIVSAKVRRMRSV